MKEKLPLCDYYYYYYFNTSQIPAWDTEEKKTKSRDMITGGLSLVKKEQGWFL